MHTSKEQALAAFSAVDTNNDGVVSKRELFNFLTDWTVGLSTRVVEALFSQLDQNADGEISEEEFIKGFKLYQEALTGGLSEDTTKAAQVTRASRMQSTSARPKGYREKISARGARKKKDDFKMQLIKTGTVKELRAIWDEFDFDNNGVVDYREFVLKLRSYGGTVAESAQVMFKSIDKGQNSELTFQDILRAMYPQASKREIVELDRVSAPKKEEVVVQEKKKIVLTPDQIKGAEAIFNIYDVNNDGTLTAEECKYGLKSAGYTAKEIEELFAKADTDGDRTISKNEFLAWYAEGLSDEEGEDEEE